MLSALLFMAMAPPKIELAEPFLVTAGGKVIEVEVGHAAPILVDFNGNGRKDLLVGQFGQGRLRVYPNVGTNSDPKFEGFEWFQADGKIAQVEAG
jgi:hypothetical protein